MKFYDSLLKEYLKKRDYTNGVPLNRDRDSVAKAARNRGQKSKRASLFKLRIKSFINDFMMMFSDFKERLTDGYFFENSLRQQNYPRQLKA